MTGERDLYAVLRVLPSATERQVHAAYRALAHDLHPDKNASPDASARFRELKAAYEILGDPERRAAYDAARAAHSSRPTEGASSTTSAESGETARSARAARYDSSARGVEASRGDYRWVWILVAAVAGYLVFAGGASVSPTSANPSPAARPTAVTTERPSPARFAAVTASPLTPQPTTGFASVTVPPSTPRPTPRRTVAPTTAPRSAAPTPAPTPVPPSAPPVQGLGEFAYPDGLRLIALAVREQAPQPPGMVSEIGNRLLTITVRVENHAANGFATVISSFFSIRDSSGRIHYCGGPCGAASVLVPGGFGYSQVGPGQAVVGNVTLEVPATDQRLVLLFSRVGHPTAEMRLY